MKHLEWEKISIEYLKKVMVIEKYCFSSDICPTKQNVAGTKNSTYFRHISSSIKLIFLLPGMSSITVILSRKVRNSVKLRCKLVPRKCHRFRWFEIIFEGRNSAYFKSEIRRISSQEFALFEGRNSPYLKAEIYFRLECVAVGWAHIMDIKT